VKIIRIVEVPAELFRQQLADSSFAHTGDPTNDDDHT
jgi:hypothetical protein